MMDRSKLTTILPSFTGFWSIDRHLGVKHSWPPFYRVLDRFPRRNIVVKLFYQVLPSCAELHLVWSGFTGFFPSFAWVSIEFYRILLDFSGFYHVCQFSSVFLCFTWFKGGFTEFYRVLPSLTGFHRVGVDNWGRKKERCDKLVATRKSGGSAQRRTVSGS